MRGKYQMRRLTIRFSLLTVVFLIGLVIFRIQSTNAAPTEIEAFKADAIPAITRTQILPLPDDKRNLRYCEVLAAWRDGLNIVVSVYNTMGHSDCPADEWATLESDAIKEAYALFEARLNGPRYWVLDDITGRGATIGGKSADFGGMEMRLVAQLAMPLWAIDADPPPYTVNEVQRNTTYTYLAGNLVYELISPEGDVYRMQSYSQRVDPTLTIDDLETLGERLELPEGWRYQAQVLTEDSELETNGLAFMLADELQNAYQKVIP
jgi:hypothetical protein